VLRGQSFAPFAAGDVADARDRALANRLVTAALRYHGPINQLIGQLLERGLPKKSGRFEAVLRLSLAQLLFLPDLGDHSALFLAGEAMRADPKSQHLIKLINGVLREAQRRRDTVAVNAGTLFPSQLLDTWRDAYGADAVEAFGRALLEGAPLDLTVKSPVAALDAAPVLADTVPGYEASALFGMGAPKKTPPEIIEKLNKEINAVLAEPAIKAKLIDLGGEPLIGTPEAFGKMIVAETEKWEKVVKAAGLKVE